MVSNDQLFGRGVCVEQMAIRRFRNRRHAAKLSIGAVAVITAALQVRLRQKQATGQ